MCLQDLIKSLMWVRSSRRVRTKFFLYCSLKRKTLPRKWQKCTLSETKTPKYSQTKFVPLYIHPYIITEASSHPIQCCYCQRWGTPWTGCQGQQSDKMTSMVNVESLFNLKCMFLECVVKPEYLGKPNRHRKNVQTLHQKPPTKIQTRSKTKRQIWTVTH